MINDQRKRGISWCDFTANPLKYVRADGRVINACVKVSEGCRNCYAEAITARFWPRGEKFPGYSLPLVSDGGHWTIDKSILDRLKKFRPRGPFRNGNRPKIFVHDMTDLFQESVPDSIINSLLSFYGEQCPHLDFLILTKRAKRRK